MAGLARLEEPPYALACGVRDSVRPDDGRFCFHVFSARATDPMSLAHYLRRKLRIRDAAFMEIPELNNSRFPLPRHG